MLQWLDSLPIDKMALLVGCVLTAILLMVIILASACNELYKLLGEIEKSLLDDSKRLDSCADNLESMGRNLDDLARREPAFYDELAQVDWPTLLALVSERKNALPGDVLYYAPISEFRSTSGESATVAQTHGVVAEPPRPGILVSEVQGLWDATKLALDAKATERHGYHNEDVIPFDVARAEDDGMGWQRPGVE